MAAGTRKNQTLSIDGISVVIEEGDTLLTAARRADLGDCIPALCYREGSAPDGGCGLCLVQVTEGEREDSTAELAHACHTLARPGSRVVTTTRDIEANRRALLALMYSELPSQAAAKSRGGGQNADYFWKLLRDYDIEGAAGEPSADAQIVECSHPYLRFDPELCITCRRCLHACEDLQGQFVFGVGARGAMTGSPIRIVSRAVRVWKSVRPGRCSIAIDRPKSRETHFLPCARRAAIVALAAGLRW
jgi:predicted molibdopterin-dependent oxidoreductase YjgC